MSFSIRNLDVDVTRFNVMPLDRPARGSDRPSEFVSVRHQPGHIAPGMASKITVEVAAREPAVVEQLVEVRVKAHIIRVPVMARVFAADEYDELDANSVRQSGRHIGKHRAGVDGQGKGPVEVAEEAYCKR